jgi:hypothetical protein
MIDATISRPRDALCRVWAAPGTASRPLRGLSAAPSASRRQSVTDATSIGNGLPPRPRAVTARPTAGERMASII